MEIRNLQITGGKSYIITLPKKWIIANFLKNKDKVKIFDHKKYLKIIPFSYKKAETFQICQIDNLTKSQIEREIIGYYLSGVDNIIVKAKNMTYEQRAAVRYISYKLIGCECLESSTNQMLLKNTSNSADILIPEYIKRMVSIIILMYQDTLNYLKNEERAMARDVIERDIEIDRLNLAMIRSNNIFLNGIEIEDKNLINLFDSHFYELVAIRLERIADHIVRIGKYYLLTDRNYKPVFNSLEKSVLKNTLRNLNLCQEMLISLDKQKAHNCLDDFDEFSKLQVKKKYSGQDYFNLVVAESLSRINSYIANIAEEIINYLNTKLTTS
jgi:phosphate uptake regulator